MHHILLIVLIIGLIGGGKEETITLTSAKGGKNYGGVFRINMIRGNPNGLDPVIINSKLADDIALQVYDRLISFDSSLGGDSCTLHEHLILDHYNVPRLQHP